MRELADAGDRPCTRAGRSPAPIDLLLAHEKAPGALHVIFAEGNTPCEDDMQ